MAKWQHGKISGSGSVNSLSEEDLEGVKSAVEEVIASEDFIQKLAIALNEKLQFQFKETEFKETLCDLNKRMVALEEENKSLKNELDTLQTKDKTLRGSVSDQYSKSAKTKNGPVINKTQRFDKNKNSSQKYKTKSASNQIQPSSKTRIPEKYEIFYNQIKSLSMDTEVQMQSIIDLLYNKAVDDPNFSDACALITKEFGCVEVPVSITKPKNKKKQFVNFRDLLIKKCQNEFEIYLVEANVLKYKEAEECTDPKIQREQQLQLEEDYEKIYNKLNGNIILIGDLFNHQLLSVSIMLNCIHVLLENKDENNLECLCTLLNSAGYKLIYARNPNLQPFFQTMQEIVDKNDENISGKTKRMLQDVIDVRNSKNGSTRKELKPKTMKPTQKAAGTKQMNTQIKNTPQINNLMGSASGSKLMIKPASPVPSVSNISKLYAAMENASDQNESLLNKEPSELKKDNMVSTSSNKNYEDGSGFPSGSELTTIRCAPTVTPVSTLAAPFQIQQEMPVVSSAPATAIQCQQEVTNTSPASPAAQLLAAAIQKQQELTNISSAPAAAQLLAAAIQKQQELPNMNPTPIITLAAAPVQSQQELSNISPAPAAAQLPVIQSQQELPNINSAPNVPSLVTLADAPVQSQQELTNISPASAAPIQSQQELLNINPTPNVPRIFTLGAPIQSQQELPIISPVPAASPLPASFQQEQQQQLYLQFQNFMQQYFNNGCTVQQKNCEG